MNTPYRLPAHHTEQLRPDYQGGGLVNLMASIRAVLGLPSAGYAPLNLLPPQALTRRHIILLVIDGLGYEYLTQRHPESHLARHLSGRLTSVFPSTTASAVTSYFTATAPQQHAITGWFTYLKELGSVATILPFHPRHGGSNYTQQGITPNQIVGQPPLFSHETTRALRIVTANQIIDTAYSMAMGGKATRHGYNDLSGVFDHLQGLAQNNAEDDYIFAYWAQLDSLAHRFGIESPEVASHFLELDNAFADFLAAIDGSDSTVIVTADHGLIDTDSSHMVHLDDHPILADTLALPLCGEPRAAFCYVRPDKRQVFEEYLSTHLAHCCEWIPSRRLLVAGYFGAGTPHPRLRDRIGDYTLLMKDRYVIKDRLVGEEPFHHIGVHGGLSSHELFIPLIVAQR